VSESTRYQHPWQQRLAYSLYISVMTGFGSAALHPNPSWNIVALSAAGGLGFFLLWPLVKPRRSLRDPVREESLAATEEAIRLAELEIEGPPDRTA
jgi:hypothetical protein